MYFCLEIKSNRIILKIPLHLIQSTLVISKSKGPSKTVRDIRTRTRFFLRDKRLFEITEVEITRVDCIGLWNISQTACNSSLYSSDFLFISVRTNVADVLTSGGLVARQVDRSGAGLNTVTYIEPRLSLNITAISLYLKQINNSHCVFLNVIQMCMNTPIVFHHFHKVFSAT